MKHFTNNRTSVLRYCQSVAAASAVSSMLASCAQVPPKPNVSAPSSAPVAQIPTIAIDASLVQSVLNGTETITIRSGRRNYAVGPAVMKSPDRTIPIEITKLEFKTFGELNDEDAKGDGGQSVAELKRDLLRFYPTLKDGDPMTLVYFHVR